MGGQRAIPWHRRGSASAATTKKWFSNKTNYSSWKAHLSNKHGRSQVGNDKASSAPSSDVLVQTTLKPVSFLDHVAHKYKNIVVDFVIGGDISLRAARGTRFKELLQSLTNGYLPSSTRTIFTCMLYLIARPLLATFYSSLNIAISLTLNVMHS
jgi:hypothetical protein